MPWILTFLTFLIVVYFGGHLYILLHISSFLSGEPWKYSYYIFYAILAIWWIVARVLDNRDFPRWSDILLTIGSFALPWMFYSSIFLIAYDFCLLFASLFDVSYLLFSPAVRLGLFLGLHGFVFLWLIFGYVNARSPTIIMVTSFIWWLQRQTKMARHKKKLEEVLVRPASGTMWRCYPLAMAPCN